MIFMVDSRKADIPVHRIPGDPVLGGQECPPSFFLLTFPSPQSLNVEKISIRLKHDRIVTVGVIQRR